jgi:hypothetical protein
MMDYYQNQNLKIIAVMFLMLPIVLSSSKSGLFSLGLILMVQFIYDILIKKSYLKVLVFSSLFMVSATMLLL